MRAGSAPNTSSTDNCRSTSTAHTTVKNTPAVKAIGIRTIIIDTERPWTAPPEPYALFVFLLLIPPAGMPVVITAAPAAVVAAAPYGRTRRQR